MRLSSAIKTIMFHTGIMALARRRAKSNTVAILRYHAIVEPEKNYYASPLICLAPDIFEVQVRYLMDHYNVVSLDTVADCIISNKLFPERAVVLTFDDGYRDNYLAYQILNRYRVTGTFYVTAGCIDSDEPLWLFEVTYLINSTKNLSLELNLNGNKIFFPLKSISNKRLCIRKIIEIVKSNNLKTREELRMQLRNQIEDIFDLYRKAKEVMLSWEQLKEMSDNGMEIGAHTLTHLNLPNAEHQDAVQEIRECKKLIEEKTKRPVQHFSFPNGGSYSYYNDSIKKAVKDAGYITSTTSNNGVVGLNSDLLELNRIRIVNNLPEITYQIDCEPIVDKIFGTA